MIILNTRIYLIFLLFVTMVSYGQDQLSITASVVDGSNGDAVSFVNIGVVGTLTGTASNANGEFSINIPAEHLDKQLYFSAIGYQNFEISIHDYAALANKTIKLEPLSYGIEGIEISTRSQVLYRKVRDASASISKNFIVVPFECKAIYSTQMHVGNALQQKRDALISLSDKSAYGNRDNAFEARNYQLINVIRNFEIESLNDGTLMLDELLTFDIARTGGNILDTLYLDAFNMEMLEETDDTWTIAYQHPAPNLSISGDYYAKSIEGKLTIAKKGNILLSAEAAIKANFQSVLGRGFAADTTNCLRNVDYHYTISYQNSPKGYLPEQITCTKNYINKQGKPVKLEASLSVIGIEINDPVLHTQRQYFEKMLSDFDFWEQKEQ